MRILKVRQLIYNDQSNRIWFDDEALHCGSIFEVLIFNQTAGQAEWIPTRLELDGNDQWYLTGLRQYQVSGLFARM